MRLVITYYRKKYKVYRQSQGISHDLLSVFFLFFYSYLSTKCHEISHDLLSTEFL